MSIYRIIKIHFLLVVILLPIEVAISEPPAPTEIDPPEQIFYAQGVADYNRDEKMDVFLIEEQSISIELYDTNFDGQTNESWRYNLEGVPISGNRDLDFDGKMETSVQLIDGSVSKELTDSDDNNYYDIVTVYRNGVVQYSERYYVATANLSARIGRIDYEYGYPSGVERFEATEMKECDYSSFHAKEDV
jgi:hypothetical protein